MRFLLLAVHSRRHTLLLSSTPPPTPPLSLFLSLLLLQQERQEQVARDLGPLMMRKPKADSLCVPQPVDRRSSLSYQEFLQEYSLV